MPLNRPIRQNDEQRADADDVHLDKNVVGVMGAAEDIPERPAAQKHKILKRLDGRF